MSDFAVSLRRELDYLSEGRNAERLATNFADSPDVHIPRVFWATTTSRVLTLERVVGTKVDDLEGLDRAGVDRRALATKAASVSVRMVFEHGFFHADPHPGNLFIEPDGRIGLIDFGMVGFNSGVISNAHDKISATGKPRIKSSTTRRTAQFGISKKGKTCVAIWMRSQPTTA